MLVVKKLVVFFILLSLIYSLFSCDNNSNAPGTNGYYPRWDFYPRGYTAGFPSQINKSAPRVEYWWVETYDECLAAIELLRSHGSTFAKTAFFTHDGELFDTKYCFEITLEHRLTEPIQFGDNPFDRCAGDVIITSYAFFEDVTIDEINHADVYNYNPHMVNTFIMNREKAPVISEDSARFKWFSQRELLYVYDVSDNEMIFSVTSFGYYDNPDKGRECLKVVFETMQFIGFDD